jgi:hypothetical protein
MVLRTVESLAHPVRLAVLRDRPAGHRGGACGDDPARNARIAATVTRLTA